MPRVKTLTHQIHLASVLVLAALAVSACGSAARVLVIKSDPADADVCIKGKAKSERFSNQKSCVGQTPFEADRVEVLEPGGDKHTVKFKDIEADQESFYVVITKKGYSSQSFEVPGWEHFVTLKQEGVPIYNAPTTNIVSPAAAQQPVATGTVRIQSEPSGALVYINDVLKGNTPFTFEGAPSVVRLKLEQAGYVTQEKALTIESGRTIDVNFRMISNAAAAQAVEGARPQESKPLPAKTAPQTQEAEEEVDELPGDAPQTPSSAGH